MAFSSATSTFAGVTYNLTEAQFREMEAKRKEDSHFWKVFWARVMKDNGLTNAEVAKRLEIPESSVRRIKKKEG